LVLSLSRAYVGPDPGPVVAKTAPWISNAIKTKARVEQSSVFFQCFVM